MKGLEHAAQVPISRARLVWASEHEACVLERVRKARTSVWIATANLKDVHVAARRGRRYVSMLSELDQLAGQGVELRILHASLPSGPFRATFDRHERLWSGGLQLRQCPRVHMKLIVVDGAFAYIGSANWTGAGLGAKGEDRRNFELGVVTDDERTLDEVQGHFDRIWRGAACGACRLREQCEAPLDLSARRPGPHTLERF